MFTIAPYYQLMTQLGLKDSSRSFLTNRVIIIFSTFNTICMCPNIQCDNTKIFIWKFSLSTSLHKQWTSFSLGTGVVAASGNREQSSKVLNLKHPETSRRQKPVGAGDSSFSWSGVQPKYWPSGAYIEWVHWTQLPPCVLHWAPLLVDQLYGADLFWISDGLFGGLEHWGVLLDPETWSLGVSHRVLYIVSHRMFRH
jgi:hypothetical protein